jgi:hypothetical protein
VYLFTERFELCVLSVPFSGALRQIIFMGCFKRFFTALRAELYFERHVIFTISRSEIVKMTCLLEEYSAAVGGKRLFTQPHILFKGVV